MSRIGKKPIEIPSGVEVKIDGNVITAKGPKGTETVTVRDEVKVSVADNHVIVEPNSDDRKTNALHGLFRTLIANAIHGVSQGFEKKLEIVGVGYKFNASGNKLTISAGYSHPVVMEVPNGLSVTQISNTEIEISGIDKVKIGEFAANIRKVRSPEPYKGKGIKYKGEQIRRKEGKKASK